MFDFHPGVPPRQSKLVYSQGALVPNSLELIRVMWTLRSGSQFTSMIIKFTRVIAIV